eukprot:gene10882-3586_t
MKLLVVVLVVFVGIIYNYNIQNSGYSLEVILKAPPKDILPWFIDEKITKWADGIIDSKIIGNKETKKGLKIVQVYQMNENYQLKMNFEVINYEKEKLIQFDIDSEAFQEILTVTFERIAERETKIFYHADLRWKSFITKILSPITSIYTKYKLQKSFDKLKELLCTTQ